MVCPECAMRVCRASVLWGGGMGIVCACVVHGALKCPRAVLWVRAWDSADCVLAPRRSCSSWRPRTVPCPRGRRGRAGVTGVCDFDLHREPGLRINSIRSFYRIHRYALGALGVQLAASFRRGCVPLRSDTDTRLGVGRIGLKAGSQAGSPLV
jgi:hypothetical protein